MKQISSLGKLLAAVVAGALFLAGPSTALPQEQPWLEARRAAADPWVTVDSTGGAKTITPTVTTINGARTTISPPPANLVATSTYILSPSGRASTYTGEPPVASPTGSGDAGAFMSCAEYQSESPICQPKSGSQLTPGRTYYVTWSSETFDNKSLLVEVQVKYPNNTGVNLPLSVAQKGFAIWDVPANALDGLSGTSRLNVTLYLAYSETQDGDDQEVDVRLVGPAVFIAADNGWSGSGSGFNMAIVALPITIAIVLILTVGVCLWRCKKGKGATFEGFPFGRRTAAAAYAARNSRSEHMGPGGGDVKSKAPTVGIQLTNRDSWSPTTPQPAAGGLEGPQPDRNVFREEIRRQERETGW